MKKIFLFLSVIIFSVNVFSQAPAIQWQKCLGGTGYEYPTSIQQTADGGFVVAGWTSSNDGDVNGNHGFQDYWVVKLDFVGNIQWQKCYGGINGDNANCIQQTLDGGYIVAGGAGSNDGDVSGQHGSGDYWIVKLDNVGGIQWQKCFGGTSGDGASYIQQTQDSGYIVTGSAISNNGDVSGNHSISTCNDFWIIKLDMLGNLKWQKCLGGNKNEFSYSIQQTADGGYVNAGWTTTFDNTGDVNGFHGGKQDGWLVRIDSGGSLLWQRCLGGANPYPASNEDGLTSALQTSDGDFIVAGYANANDGDVSGNHDTLGIAVDAWVVKLSGNGIIQWQKCLGGTGSEVAFDIKQTQDGGYIIAGRASSNDGDVSGLHGVGDGWIVKLNSAGIIQWQKCLGGSQWESLYSVKQTQDGGYIVAGVTSSYDGDVSGNHGGQDMWVVKLAPEVGIEENNSLSSTNIFPNPATNEIRIESLKFKVQSVEVYDVMGRLTLNPSPKGEGLRVEVDVSKLSPGIYFVKVKGEKEERVGKFVKQ